MSDFERARQAVIELYNASPETQEVFSLGDHKSFMMFHPVENGTKPYSFAIYDDGSVSMLTHAPFNNADREDVRRLREIVRDYLTGILAE